MRSIQRLLDANANRAREAMRVMEDAARFVLDDRKLASELKTLRHKLTGAVRVIGCLSPPLELNRDTPGDVGTGLSTKGERSRGSVHDVVTASCKRLSEALRCLEEYAKPAFELTAQRFKQQRYRAYELEKRLLMALGSRRARQWRLCVVLTESLCVHRNWFEVARAAVEAGADCIQLREKSLEGRELLERAMRLGDLSYHHGRKGDRSACCVIVNDRADIAAMAYVDGVHLGRFDPDVDRVRAWIGADRIIGATTHNLAEARRAVRAGADYCGVGTVFPTTTKPRKPSGLAYLRQFLKAFPEKPHLAIGGITPENVGRVVDAGVRGIAVSSCVCGAEKPGAVVRKLLRVIPK